MLYSPVTALCFHPDVTTMCTSPQAFPQTSKPETLPHVRKSSLDAMAAVWFCIIREKKMALYPLEILNEILIDEIIRAGGDPEKIKSALG